MGFQRHSFPRARPLSYEAALRLDYIALPRAQRKALDRQSEESARTWSESRRCLLERRKAKRALRVLTDGPGGREMLPVSQPAAKLRRFLDAEARLRAALPKRRRGRSPVDAGVMQALQEEIDRGESPASVVRHYIKRMLPKIPGATVPTNAEERGVLEAAILDRLKKRRTRASQSDR